jgi:hypothetical protein
MLDISQNGKVLHLHIGMGKAGSTTIQDFLRQVKKDNQAWPIDSFGAIGNAWKLAASSGTDKARRYWVDHLNRLSEDSFYRLENKLWIDLHSEVSSQNKGNFIASSEHISSHYCNNEDDISSLKDRLYSCFSDVHIIIYVRNQIHWLKSFYCQTMKGPTRSSQKFEHFIDDMDQYKDFWDYYSLCRAWSDVFGKERTSVTLFDSRCFVDGDLIKDFCSKAEMLSVYQSNRMYRKSNITPTFNQIQILRRLNKYDKGLIFRLPSQLVRKLIGKSNFIFSDAFPDEYDGIIRSKISDSNRKMNEQFLNECPVQLPV